MTVLTLKPCSPEKLKFRKEQTPAYETWKAKRPQGPWACKSDEEYRKLEREGLGHFDKGVLDPEAEDLMINSRQGTHQIPLHIIRPKTTKACGIFLFLHPGGFVVGSAFIHDNLLRPLAERLGMVMASPEYRLAPQFKLPAGVEDCIDAAEWLLSPQAEQKVGHTLRFISGDSAGGHLTVATVLGLRDRGVNVRDKIAGIMPNYGIYDLSLLPSVLTRRPKDAPPPDASSNIMALALPTEVYGSRQLTKDPIYSPLYADLTNLPPALFAVGSDDLLLDDSILMAARWELAGNEADLIIYPATPHGYFSHLTPSLDATVEAHQDLEDFVRNCRRRSKF